MQQHSIKKKGQLLQEVESRSDIYDAWQLHVYMSLLPLLMASSSAEPFSSNSFIYTLFSLLNTNVGQVVKVT